MTVDLPPPVPEAQVGFERAAPPTSAAVIGPTTPDGTQPGDLTLTWRMVLLFGWIAAFFAYAAVWQASVQLGIATWWVGPRSQPTPTLIRMIPFILSITAALLAVYNVRRLSHISLGLAIGSLLIALPDFSRSIGLAMVEVMISGALIVVGLGSMTGRYRLALAKSEPNTSGGIDAPANERIDDAAWAKTPPTSFD